MARRKSLDQLREQAIRLRSQARRAGQYERAAAVRRVYERYANNIRDTRRFQRDRDRFLNLSDAARRAEMEDIDRASALYGQTSQAYSQAIDTPVSRRIYMGLNGG